MTEGIGIREKMERREERRPDLLCNLLNAEDKRKRGEMSRSIDNIFLPLLLPSFDGVSFLMSHNVFLLGVQQLIEDRLHRKKRRERSSLPCLLPSLYTTTGEEEKHEALYDGKCSASTHAVQGLLASVFTCVPQS